MGNLGRESLEEEGLSSLGQVVSQRASQREVLGERFQSGHQGGHIRDLASEDILHGRRSSDSPALAGCALPQPPSAAL